MDDVQQWVLALTAGPGVLLWGVSKAAPWLAKWGAHRAGAEEASARAVHEREATGRIYADISRSAWEQMHGKVRILEEANAHLIERIAEIEEQRDALFDDVVALHNAIKMGRTDVPPLRIKRSLPPIAIAEFVKRTNGDNR